jgi:SAM-dependent methyltransferase
MVGEGNMKKVHLGCGTVYLEGYQNIDITGLLASEHPELVEHNKTTVDKYYKYPFRENKGNVVVDEIMDIRKLTYEDNSVDKIITVNTIDHFKKEDFIVAAKDWYRVLKPEGVLIIDVDDRKKQAEILTHAETIEDIEWALRLIYCDHMAPGRSHMWGYTESYLQFILEQIGFKFVWLKNDYILHDITSNFQIMVKK